MHSNIHSTSVEIIYTVITAVYEIYERFQWRNLFDWEIVRLLIFFAFLNSIPVICTLERD